MATKQAPGDPLYETLRAKSEPNDWCWVNLNGQVYIPINDNEVRTFYPMNMEETEPYDKNWRKWAGPKKVPDQW